jgi:hypothetical protein
VSWLGRATALGAAWSLAALRASSAQVSVSMDLGASRVEYDGFLPSAAFSASPALRFTSPTASFAARGTWLGFESGNSSVQALLAGSIFTPAARRWRGELAATAGASSYEGLASFAHALARGRVHYLHRSGGLWLAGTVGRASYDDGTRPVVAAAAGVWQGRRLMNVTLAISATRVGDTAYADVEGSAYWQRGRLELEGSLGARGGRGGGRGVYGEAVATIALSQPVALTLGLGRYPTDPIRGSVSGRYASAGVRLTALAPRPTPRPIPAWPQPQILPAMSGTNGHVAVATVTLEITAGKPVLLVRAPGAALVEVMGDFTDWQAVVLTRVGDVWRLDTHLAAGLRRLNVRVDGAAWSVPMGATLTHDDFGATVGTIVVP